VNRKIRYSTQQKEVEMSTSTTSNLGFVGRTVLFFRQVVAELKKVVWPTKEQVVTYTGVVIVFVTILALIVAGLDFGFTRLVLLVFG
jgi:preprotein translocase subunit SecE